MLGYYYCSLSTFLNIIKNKQVYLSDPLKMNDSLEIKWYLEKLNNEARALNRQEFDLPDSIFEKMKSRSHLDFTFEEFMEKLDSRGQRSIYISCFSKNPDLLSQWRAYAEDGTGVSIGFDLNKLSVAPNILLKEVIYTNDVVYENKEYDVLKTADTIGTVINENNIIKKDEQLEVFLHELIPELAKYKNPAFKEEKEVRLIYCDDLKFENVLDKYHAFEDEWSPIKLNSDFRVTGNNEITEFVKLDFDPSAIKKIYIGPKCSLSENDVSNIINKIIGKKIIVKKSRASYR